jgi:hypothetical protein
MQMRVVAKNEVMVAVLVDWTQSVSATDSLNVFLDLSLANPFANIPFVLFICRPIEVLNLLQAVFPTICMQAVRVVVRWMQLVVNPAVGVDMWCVIRVT